MAADGVDGNVGSKGALEIFARIAGALPHLGRSGTTHADVLSVAGWRVVNRREATHALRMIVGGVGRDPLKYALYSGRIGGATQLAAQEATNVQIQRASR